MAEPTLEGVLRRPFPEQLAALRLRFADLRATATWRDLWHDAHDRAFVVAGAVKADLLADLAQAVDRAAAEGRGLDWFRAEFGAIVARHGWHGWTGEGTTAGEAWRTRVIWQTNIATSYAAGRRAQLVAGRFRLWVYRHGGSREPRPHHLAWDGLALPPDHPFWATHSPPNGWGCSCYVVGANTAAGVRRVGGDPDLRLPDGWSRTDPRTGAPPGIDRGWSYAPGATATDDITRIVRDKAARLPTALARDLAAAAAPAPPPAEPPPTVDAVAALLGDVLDFKSDHFAGALRGALPLAAGDKAVLNAYTQPWLYADLNAYLRRQARGAAAADDRLDTFARWTQAALARLDAYGGTTWRGIEADAVLLDRFAALAAGDMVRFTAFSSTSKAEATILAGNIVLEIVGRTGRHIGPVSYLAREQEVLFAPGATFRVVARTLTRDGGVAELRLVLEETDAPPDGAVQLFTEIADAGIAAALHRIA